MIPVFFGFLVLAEPLVAIVYHGRYAEAIPQLRLFALLSFVVTANSVGSNVLLGLGEARAGFILGMQSLAASVVLYLVLIPWLGITGATLGYVLSSAVLAVLSMRLLRHFVPFTTRGVFRRWKDIINFLRRFIAGLTEQSTN